MRLVSRIHRCREEWTPQAYSLVAVFSQLPLIYRPAVTTGFLHAQNDPGEASVDTVIKRFDSWPIRQLRPFSAE